MGSGSLGSIIVYFLYNGSQRNTVYQFKARALGIEIISELTLRDLAKMSLSKFSTYQIWERWLDGKKRLNSNRG